MRKKLLVSLLFFCLILFTSCNKTVQKFPVKESENTTETIILKNPEKPQIPNGFFKYAKVADSCFLKDGDMCFVISDFKNEELLKKYYDGTESCAVVFFDNDFNIKDCFIPKDLCGSENSVVFNGEYIYICTLHTLSKYTLNGERKNFIPVSSNENNEIFISDNCILLKSNENTSNFNFNLKEIKNR